MKTQFILTSALKSGLFIGISLLFGCAGEPSMGERMIQQSSGTAELGYKWQTGNEKIQKGEKLIQEGKEIIDDARNDMRKGEDKVSEGQTLIDDGQKLKQETEREYNLRFPAVKN